MTFWGNFVDAIADRTAAIREENRLEEARLVEQKMNQARMVAIPNYQGIAFELHSTIANINSSLGLSVNNAVDLCIPDIKDGIREWGFVYSAKRTRGNHVSTGNPYSVSAQRMEDLINNELKRRYTYGGASYTFGNKPVQVKVMDSENGCAVRIAVPF